MKALKNEWTAGYHSGTHHDNADRFYRDNLPKMAKGVRNIDPFIQAYWKGYREGYYSRFEGILSIHPKERVKAKRELRQHCLALNPKMNYRKLCNLVRATFEGVTDKAVLSEKIGNLEEVVKGDRNYELRSA